MQHPPRLTISVVNTAVGCTRSVRFEPTLRFLPTIQEDARIFKKWVEPWAMPHPPRRTTSVVNTAVGYTCSARFEPDASYPLLYSIFSHMILHKSKSSPLEASFLPTSLNISTFGPSSNFMVPT